MKDAIYFDSFGVEHIPKVKKIKNKKVTRIKKKNTKTNLFRIQANSSTMSGIFTFDFFMLCFQLKLGLIKLACFHLMILKLS